MSLRMGLHDVQPKVGQIGHVGDNVDFGIGKYEIALWYIYPVSISYVLHHLNHDFLRS